MHRRKQWWSGGLKIYRIWNRSKYGKGVRTRNYQGYYNYMNSEGMKIKTVKYFRFKEEN